VRDGRRGAGAGLDVSGVFRVVGGDPQRELLGVVGVRVHGGVQRRRLRIRHAIQERDRVVDSESGVRRDVVIAHAGRE